MRIRFGLLGLVGEYSCPGLGTITVYNYMNADMHALAIAVQEHDLILYNVQCYFGVQHTQCGNRFNLKCLCH